MYIGLNDRFNNNINENQFKDLYVNHNDYTMFDLSNNVIKSDFSNKSDINNRGAYLSFFDDLNFIVDLCAGYINSFVKKFSDLSYWVNSQYINLLFVVIPDTNYNKKFKNRNDKSAYISDFIENNKNNNDKLRYIYLPVRVSLHYTQNDNYDTKLNGVNVVDDKVKDDLFVLIKNFEKDIGLPENNKNDDRSLYVNIEKLRPLQYSLSNAVKYFYSFDYDIIKRTTKKEPRGHLFNPYEIIKNDNTEENILSVHEINEEYYDILDYIDTHTETECFNYLPFSLMVSYGSPIYYYGVKRDFLAKYDSSIRQIPVEYFNSYQKYNEYNVSLDYKRWSKILKNDFKYRLYGDNKNFVNGALKVGGVPVRILEAKNNKPIYTLLNHKILKD